MAVDTARFGRTGVGYGSYIVNAVGGCNDCHTNPPYTANGNPHAGQPEHINAAKFLGGGVSFGPTITSPNITPDRNGLPAGIRFVTFRDTVMREGKDPHDSGKILQVMPWPVYGKMTDCDLAAVYLYLRAIPSVPGNRGSTAPPQQPAGLDQPAAAEAGVAVLADDDMVVQLDLDRLQRRHDLAGHLDVGLRGRRVAARVVVDHDDRRGRRAPGRA